MGAGHRKYTREYMIQRLIEASKDRGITASKAYMDKLHGFPCGNAYKKMFGSWMQALTEAGLTRIPSGGSRYRGGKARGECHPYARTGRRRQLTLADRFRIMERDSFTCQYCGRTPDDGAKLLVDHILPFAKGGETNIDNSITSCFECNIGKRDMILSNYPRKGNQEERAAA